MFNGGATLNPVLTALDASRDVVWETIVVDDGSTDHSAAIARAHGCRLARTADGPVGPARARNLGAAEANAPLLFFLDADVVVRPDTIASLVAVLREDPALVAAFGSYDESPAAPGLVSQYRNLLHHYVHQTARRDAGTFWAGCGIIRRDEFEACGGFSAAYSRPSIEDIELGHRLTAAGHRIRVVPEVQVKHLKQWTLRGVLVTDIRDRAIPWSRLILQAGQVPNDLNLTHASRISGLSVLTLVALLGAGWWRRRAWLATGFPIVALIACNLGLYRFFWQRRGPRFTAGAVLLHWLYYGYSTVVFAALSVSQRLRARARQATPLGWRKLVRV